MPTNKTILGVVASAAQVEAIDQLKALTGSTSRSKLLLHCAQAVAEAHGITWPQDDLPHGGDRRSKDRD